jgi:hypothetical protein
LGDDQAVTRQNTVIKATLRMAMLALLGATVAQAEDLGGRPLRYGHTSGWFYDNRDDGRDVPNNGFFPGNFTADPLTAWLGAAGLAAGNSYRSPQPYPSQVIIAPAHTPATCAQRYRSYDPATGTFLGRDGKQHPC